jgi:hypothetical protein
VIGGRADSAAPISPQVDGDLELGPDAAPSVVMGAWLRRATPSPTSWRRGTLAFTPGHLEWQPRRPGLQPGPRAVALQQVDVTRVRTTTVREVLRVDRSCTVFGLATDIELLELAVLPADLPAARAALRGCRSQP